MNIGQTLVKNTGLSIGNVYFAINSEYPIRILEHVEKTHGSFRSVNPLYDDMLNFDVSIVVDNEVASSECGKLIGETSSWKVYESGDGERELMWSEPDGNGCLWRLIIDKSRLAATIYVSDNWIENDNGAIIIKDIINYPLDELLFMYAASGRDGLLVHSAGCAIGEDGIVFCGKSGAGKSTISKQLIKNNNIKLLSDDRIIIYKHQETLFMAGTPWPGEAGIAANKSVPLKSLQFLHKSSDNRIERISVNEALKQLLPVASILWHEKDMLPQTLDFCEYICQTVPVYNFYFTLDRNITII